MELTKWDEVADNVQKKENNTLSRKSVDGHLVLFPSLFGEKTLL